MKWTAGCNEFEPNKVVNLQNVSSAEENKRRKVKKNKTKKKMVETDMEIATLNEQKTVDCCQSRLQTEQSAM